MSRETFSKFDAADYLGDEEDIAAFLDAAAAEDDPATSRSRSARWPARAT
jgi:DNA-binding phage protein